MIIESSSNQTFLHLLGILLHLLLPLLLGLSLLLFPFIIITLNNHNWLGLLLLLFLFLFRFLFLVNFGLWISFRRLLGFGSFPMSIMWLILLRPRVPPAMIPSLRLLLFSFELFDFPHILFDLSMSIVFSGIAWASLSPVVVRNDLRVRIR